MHNIILKWQILKYLSKKENKTLEENFILKHSDTKGVEIPVFVFTKEKYKLHQIVRALNSGLFKRSKKIITEVWLLLDKQLVTITREEIEKKFYYKRITKRTIMTKTGIAGFCCGGTLRRLFHCKYKIFYANKHLLSERLKSTRGELSTKIDAVMWQFIVVICFQILD